MNPGSNNQTNKDQARLGRFHRHTSIALLVAVLALLGIATETRGANGNDTWQGGGGAANFSLSGNWTSDSANKPPITGDSLVFGTAGANGATLICDQNSFTYGGITFNSGASAFTMGGNPFTLNGSIANNGTALETINNNITLGANTTISLNSGGGNLTLNGSISGAKSITLAGAGTLTLNGVNSFTGGCSVGAGQQINFNNSSVGGSSGNGIISGGTIDNTSLAVVTLGANSGTWSGDFTFGGTSPLFLGYYQTMSGGSRTVTVNGSLLALTRYLSDGGNNYSLTKAGPGILMLNPSGTAAVKFNTTAGSSTLTLGQSSVASVTLGQSVTGTGVPPGAYVTGITITPGTTTNVTISANATATGTGVTMSFYADTYNGNASGSTTISGGMVISVIDAGCAFGLVPASTAAGNVILNGGGYSWIPAVASNGQWPATRGIYVGPNSGSGGGTIDVPYNDKLTNLAVIADNPGGTGSLTKAGQGNLILAAANTYSAGTTVNGGGILQLDFSQSGAPTANILNGTAGGLTLGGGTFLMTGKASTVNAQTVQGVTVSGGRNYVTNIVNGATSLTFTPGAITRTAGEVDFGNTGTYSGASGTLGAWATYNGLSDFAVVGSGSIAAQNSTTGVPTSGGSSSGNYYTNANTTTLTGPLSANTLRLAGGTVALGANNLTIASGGGVLATANSTLSGSGNLGDSASELIIQTKSGATLTNSAPLIGSGPGGLTVGGAGTLLLSSANHYTGATTVDGGTLTIATNGSLAAGSAVKVNTGGTLTINSGGTVSGNVEVAPSTANSANFNNSGTLSGTLTIDAAEAPVAGNPNTIGPVAPGYATLNGGSYTAAIVNNGVLNIAGSTPLAAIGNISSSGYGELIVSATANNTLTLGNGSSFSFIYPQVNSVSTLQVANSGTVGISWFGYQNTATNSSCTLQNGTFNIGQLGQNNSGAQFVGTVKVTNSATVNVLNGGFAHGTWNVNSGTLNFYGAVSEGGNAANNIGLNLAVPAIGSSASALNILGGGLTLALGAANGATESNSLSVNTGGSVNIGGGLALGSSTAQANSESNTVTLANGKLLVNGTVSATVAGSVMNNFFNWTGGQLSALTITPSAAFNGSGSSINSTTLSQTAGTMAPGDVGYSGLTTINGGYTLNSSATIAIDIGGTTASAAFQDATNAGRYDKIAVTGALNLGNSTLNVSLINGFTPNNSDNYTIMTCASSSGTFGNLSGGLIRLANGGSFTVTVNSTSVVLSNYQVGETWRGTTANWTDANAWKVGATPVTYATGDTVNFDDTALSGSVGVLSTVTPAAVLFNNSTLAYTLSGAGAIGGTTSVTKNGSATVSLNLANTYTGNTYINAGTLALTGSGSMSSTPIIFVAGGAKFDVSGKSSAFVLQSSQTISNSPTSLATLAGNLNASAGTFAITFYPGTAPLTITNGTLTLSAGTVFNLSNLGPRLGTCALITAGPGGSVAGTPPYSTPGSITLNGGTGHLAITSGALVLVVDIGGPAGVEPLHWTGSGSGTWDSADSGNTIWKDSTTPTALSVYYVDGDTVQFDEQYISANQAVTLDTAVSPASTLVSNPNYNYTISGAGGIGGGSLTKTGAGTLTLATANTYMGGTIISNGVVQMGNATALGGNGATVNVQSGGVLDVNGITMTSANTNILTLNGAGPAGGGALINSSATAANFFGPIALGSASTIKATGQALNLGSGSSDPITGSYVLTVGGSSQVDAFGNIQVASVTKVDGNVLRIESANSFAGGLTVKAGAAVAKNAAAYGTGTVYLLDTAGANSATLNLGTSSTFNNTLIVQSGSTGIATLDNYSGYSPTWAGNITLNTNLTLRGGSGQTLTVSGAISGSGGLSTASYNSDCTINLSGTNIYSGATSITIGKLALIGNGSISNTTSITVSGGATFDVTATTSGNFVLKSGQTLGNTGGTANLNGNFNASSGGIAVSYDGATPVFSVTTGNLTLAVGTAFTVNPTAGVLALGTYNLITSGVSGTAPTTVTMARGGGHLVINGGGGLDLVVTSTAGPVEPLHWAGTGTGLWQSGTPTNVWKDSSAVPAYTAYLDNLDNVQFDQLFISGDQVVTLNSTVTPPSILVNNATYNYTISGTGTIGGSASLTKTGNSNLVVQCGINTTGELTNNGGTIKLVSGGVRTVGGLSGSGGTLDVTTNRLTVGLTGQTDTYSGNVAGNCPSSAGTASSFGLLVTNSGTLALNGAVTLSADFGSLGGSSSFSRIGAQYGGELDLGGTTTLTNVTIWNSQLGIVRVTGGSHSVTFTGGNNIKETAYGVILQDSSQFIVDGGSLLVPTFQIGYGGSPINAGPSLTVNGGALTVGTTDTYTTNGLWIGNNVSAGTVSTLNLNGGVLTVTTIVEGGGGTYITQSGNNVINFNGGKLVCASTNVIPTDNGYNGANPLQLMVGDGGAVIDTGGYDNTIILPLQNNGAGGLTKLGTGKLTLTAANSYQGATVVSNGTLLVGGSLDPASSVTVQSGGTLGGAGMIGGAVAYNSGSHAVFALGTQLTMSSSLTVVTSGTIPDVHLVLSNNVPVGTYTLATYSGGSGAFSSSPVIDSGSLAPQTAATIVTSAGTISLQVAASLTPNPTNITYTVTSPTSMTLSWPSGQGWLLQSNSVSLSNTGAWQTVTGATPPYPVTINPTRPAVFYRLKY